MPTLLLGFPARRYHATPFGHHVNEGLIEWPPSPWRLLRALLSVGYCKRGWVASMNDPMQSTPPDAAAALIQKLASVLPTYALPPAVGAHTRHYMPVARFGDAREATTLVFDTWAQIEQGEVAVTWDVVLESDEARVFAELVSGLDYLGRSESWVTARLVDGASTLGASNVSNVPSACYPCEGVAAPGPGWEQVAVMAPESADAYADWRAARIDALLSSLPAAPLPDATKSKAKDRKTGEARQAERARVQRPYPPHLMACLQADTTWLREHGWSQPPGSRRVLYWRRDDTLRAAPISDAGAAGLPSIGPRTVPFVLLSLSTTSRNDHALPTIARSLPQGERLHRQVVGARMRLAPNTHSAVLTGCDEAGRPLQGAHRHAHVLSLDLDADGHIDHLLVWAPDGLDALDQQALRSTRGTYTKGGVGPLRLVFAAAGEREDLQRLPPPFGNALGLVTRTAREWISATPFVAPRHLKPQGANSLEGQVSSELASRGFPMPRGFQWLDPQHDERARRLRHHIRTRSKGPAPAVDMGFALRLSFETPVAGPICLGYGSHFGLGRFEAVSERA